MMRYTTNSPILNLGAFIKPTGTCFGAKGIAEKGRSPTKKDCALLEKKENCGTHANVSLAYGFQQFGRSCQNFSFRG